MLVGFLGVAGYFLFTERRAHVVPYLPYALLLVFPLLHLFHSHGGHGHDQRLDGEEEDQPVPRRSANERKNFEEGPGLTAGSAEAYGHCPEDPPRYDLVYIDAFNSFLVPYQLTTRESTAMVSRLLQEDGVLMANCIDISMNRHRTVEQDSAFGSRQIVDMALKALSPGINDVTTAVTCVDYLTAILARLAVRRLPSQQCPGQCRHPVADA